MDAAPATPASPDSPAVPASPRYLDRRDMAPCTTLHFRPHGALVGDLSFFHDGDECHVFYLSKRNDDPPRLPRCELHHAVTRDLLHWRPLPPALLPGRAGEPDDDGIGGCTVTRAGGAGGGADAVYHLFYAGTNPQVIYHAESRDLVAWRKDDPLLPVIVPDPRWYMAHDAPVANPYLELGWRDPFLIYDRERGCHTMITTARLNHGPLLERGCVSRAVSTDLKRWTVQPPLYAPAIGTALEVCEIFELEGRYFLFFCHGETNTVRYRVSDRLHGPYACPADDLLLPNYMYAPRSAVVGGTRYLLPWAADRLDGRDDNQAAVDYRKGMGGTGFAWGGVLGTPQRIRATSDGIGLYYPEIVDRLAGAALIAPGTLQRAQSARGTWHASGGERGGDGPRAGSGADGSDGGRIMAASTAGLARAMLPAIGGDFLLSCTITIEQGSAAGLILRASDAGDAGYYLRLEPASGSVSLWRYPRLWMRSRPLGRRAVAGVVAYREPLAVKLIVHRHIVDAYVNDRHFLSCTVHDYAAGRFGLFVEDAEAQFAALTANRIVEQRHGGGR